MTTREKGVDEILSDQHQYINTTPELLSALYDLNLLPEQILTRADALKVVGFCTLWKRLAIAEQDVDRMNWLEACYVNVKYTSKEDPTKTDTFTHYARSARHSLRDKINIAKKG